MRTKLLLTILIFTAGLLLVATMPGYAAGLADGVTAYWNFNETGGSTVDNATGNSGLDGTFKIGSTNANATITSSSGQIGNALNLDGTKYVNVPVTGFSSPITVSFWTKNRVSTAGRQVNYFMNYSTGPMAGLAIFENADNTIRFQAANALNAWPSINASSAANAVTAAGAWFNIVATYDGTNAMIYVNGSQSGGTFPLATTIPASTASLGIGKDTFDPSTAQYIDGWLDEMIVWNRALNGTEVGDVYALGNSGQPIIAGNNVVPEPATCACVLSLVVLGLRRLRRK
jgi:hypothetical protein